MIKTKKLPIIIPLVLYHGKQKWKTKENLLSILTGPTDLMNEYIPDFKYILYDLSKYSDDEIKGVIKEDLNKDLNKVLNLP